MNFIFILSELFTKVTSLSHRSGRMQCRGYREVNVDLGEATVHVHDK